MFTLWIKQSLSDVLYYLFKSTIYAFFFKQTLWGYPSSAVHWKWQLYSLSLAVDIICLFMVLAFTHACWFHFSSTQSYLSISNSQRQSPQGAVDEFIYFLSVGNKEKKSILQRPLVHTVGSVCVCARAKAQWQSPEALASLAHTRWMWKNTKVQAYK